MASKKKSAKTQVKTAKRKVVKKAVTKKAAISGSKLKPATVVKPGPLAKVSSVYTKSTLLSTLSERSGLAKKQVATLLSELTTIVEGHLKKTGPGKFTMPGLFKMTVKSIPAKKARKGINPFTGEPTTFKAKPASRKVKITALKALKEMAG